MTERLQMVPKGASMLEFSRRFAAPRGQVWMALTSPALIPAWLFAKGAPMTNCVFEAEPGGRLRYVWVRPDGGQMGVTGRVIEIEALARIVHSELFDEDWTGGETTVTTLLVPEAGGTRLTMTIDYLEAAARDAAAASGMAAGMAEAFRHLDRMLAA